VPITIGNGNLSLGGAIMTTSAGDKVAVYVSSNVVYVDKDVDGTPTNVASGTATAIFGGDNIGWIDAAIDGNDDIHIIASCDAEQTRDVSYAICDLTTGLGAWEEAANYTQSAPVSLGCSISLDSNDKPHILYVDAVRQQGVTNPNTYYTEKTGASWATPTKIGVRADKQDVGYRPSITVRNNNNIEAFYGAFISSAFYYAYRTYTGTWSSESTYAATTSPNNNEPPTVVSTTSGTVYRYYLENQANIYENSSDTTYNSANNSNSHGVLDGTNRYIFYIDTSSDVHVISNTGSGWTDEGAQQTGTYNHVIAEWAYNNENQSGELSYIFDDGTDVFYDSFSLGAAPQTVNLNTLLLQANTNNINVSPAASTIAQNTLLLQAVISDIAVSIPAPQTVNLNALLLQSTVNDLIVSPGAASTLLDTLLFQSAVNNITVSAAAISTLLDTLLLNATANTATVSPEAVSTALNTLLLQSIVNDINVS
jgi:hypothetical protein